MHKILRFAPVKTMITKNNGAEETHMNNIIRRLCFGLGILALFCSISGTTAEAATRLTPAHLYNWAKTGNITRLQQFKRYINLQDRNRNTALCLAQQAEDRDAYALLLKFGASTKVPCHDDNDPICAVIAGEKTKISPAGILLLGAGAAAGAYFLLDDDDGGDDPVCPVDYPSTSPCRPSGNGFVTDQDSKSVNNITCYKCTYTCAPGWSAGTCPAGKACNTITSPVQCYQVTGCPIDYPFTDKGLCEADGYTCTESANGSGCWKRTGSQTCPVDYPDTKPCLPSDKGYTTTQDSVQQGFNTCYKCAYECAPGWNAGSCPAGLTCDTITSPVQCYQKKGCDTSAGNYDTQQACELANPGYDCTQAANQCWVPGAASQCPAGYDTAIQTPADCGVGGTNGWKVEFNGTSGGKQCGKCTALACETGTTQCEPAGTGFTLTQTENGDYSGNTPCLTCTYACADNYYTSENACTNNGAYQCSSVTDHGLTCWLRGNAEQCEIGSTKYQSVADCGDQGANGWTYTEHGMSGNLKCGECTPKTCQDGSSTARCTPGTYTQVASETEHGAAGDSICYLCTYACNESNAFSQQSTCQAGGYTCTPTPAEHGIVCYVRNGSQTCPDDYPSSTKCTPSGNGFTTTEDSTQVGDNTCYKCTYACATGWTPGSCPAGKACNTITTPVQCYQVTGCPVDYPFTSEETCQAGGYTCTESAPGSNCWKRGEASQCPDPSYNTSIQTPADCGVGGTNGWEVIFNGSSGGKQCGKCQALACETGTTQCEPAGTGFTLTSKENGDYNGNTPCLTCTYACASNYYTSENACTNNGAYQCSSVTGHGLTCWLRGNAEQCEIGSTQYQSVADCGTKGSLGWSYTEHGMSGDLKCGECDKLQCNSGFSTSKQDVSDCGSQGANGWTIQIDSTRYNGDEACGKCTAKTCQDGSTTAGCSAGTYTKVASETEHGAAGDSICYLCTYACNESTAFAEQSNCQAGGYTCTQVEENGKTCWLRGSASQCPSGYTAGLEDCSGKAHPEGWNYSSNGTSGGQVCGKCEAKTCTNGASTSNTSVSSCGVGGSEGWNFSINGYAGDTACGLCTARTCDTGSTDITSAADCQTTGINGWTINRVDYAGNTACNECVAKTCPVGSSTSQTCNNGTYTTGSAQETGSFQGNTPCYECSYACNESNAFASQTNCTNGGYTCTTTTENGKTCYIRNGSQSCPSEYNNGTTPCSGGTGYTYSQETTTVGSNTCYKCTYSCASGWTAGSCPSGKTCTNSITSPVACYTGAQCPSDYPFTSQATCQEGGYTCTESASGSGCWKQTGSTSCPSGYSTAYQSVDNCGTSKANGWTFSSSGTSGGLVCGKCTEKDCSSGQTTACTTSSYANVGTENTGAYSGDTQCFTCSYTCNNTSGFDSCPTGASSCGTDSVSGCKYVISCDASKGYILTNGTCACDSRFSYNSCPTGANCSQCEGKYGIDSCKEGYIEDNGTCISENAFNSKLTLTNQTAIDITISAEESKDVYGIKNGANIKNTTDSVNGGIGRITISHFGTGTAYGMYGSSSGTVTNDAGASVAIKSYNGGDAVGIYSNIGGTVINKGSVAISGNAKNAYGIYGEGQNTITNEGSIDVEGQNAYGIYVKDGQGTTVTNTETGTITVNSSPDGQAHGIFIDENSSDAVVNNFGTITVNGEVREGSSGITLNGAKLRNYSLMSFSGDADLDALGGKIYLEDGGVYEAESLKGDLAAGSSTVMGGNQDTYVQEGSLKTENADGLNLSSESALFKAEKKQNASGGYDVVLNRRNFNEFAQNASLGEYLEQNYKQGNLEGMYDDIKGASSDNDTALSIADKAGLNTLTNFADENFQVLRSLNRNMADTILKPSDEPYRVIAGYDNYNLETDNKSYLSGYDLSANSMYTFGDKRIDNKNRLGLGIGYTKISTSYDDGGDRDLNIVTVFMPWLHKFTDNLRLASVLSLGYGYGEYDRGSDRESDITDFFYGLTNELRYTVDLNGYAELEPALMLNALGYTEDGFDEGNGENDLVTKKTHNLSVEAGIGLFLKKEVKTEKYGKFAFKVGGVYYHEFASPFDDIKARHSSGSGWYYIRDDANLYQRDRAVLEAALDYEYKDIALYAKYNRLIQKNDPQLFDLGVKYKF